MAFDLSTAKAESTGFDLSTAQPENVPPEAEGQGFIDTLIGIADVAALAGTEILKEGAKGISTVGGLINPTTEQQQAVINAEAFQESLPDFQLGEQGQALVQTLTDKFKGSPEIVQEIVGAASNLGPSLAESAFQASEGLPHQARGAIAAIAGAVPGALEAASTIKAFKSATGAVNNIPAKSNIFDMETDTPSPKFVKALEARGLTIDNVVNEIPSLPLDVQPKQAVNMLIKKKLLSGARDDNLSAFKLSKSGAIEDDLIAKEALKQGFQAGDIQAAKTASDGSKARMREMIKLTRQIKANSSLAKKVRPTDIVGRSVMRRFDHIRGEADKAILDLDKIAKTKLGKLNINTVKIQDDFLADLNELDITVTMPKGSVKPTLDFEGSLISKDQTSQKIIQDSLDLLAESKTPNALRAHKLKKQLDNMLDFNKKSSAGLTDAGKKVAGRLRRSLNESIRDVSDEYGAVNDVLHETIGAMDDFQRAIGPSIDVFAEGATKAIGTDMRGLLSNRKSRIRLENSVNALDETAKNLGGKFDDDIADLVNFAEVLDDQFGAIAKTGFKNQVASGAKQAAKGKEGAFEAGVEFAAEKLEGARNINDRRAFRVMEALLKRKQ